MIDTDQLHLPTTLGDYTLESLYSFTETTITYVATQSLIKRQVLLTVLRAEGATEESVARFLESVRRKASCSEARLCAVYEALKTEDGTPYYTEELPAGQNLEQWIQSDKKMTPMTLSKALTQVAKFEVFCQKKNLASQLWAMTDVFVTDKGEVHLRNLIQIGDWNEQVSESDKWNIASIIPYLVKPGEPGMNRLLTLSKWMQGGENAPTGMDWTQILELLDTVKSQLESNATFATSASDGHSLLRLKKKSKAPLLALIGVGCVAVGLGVFLVASKNDATEVQGETPPSVVRLSDEQWPDRTEVTIAYQDPDTGLMKQLSVDKHEVTIASYEKFLNFFNKLTDKEKKVYRLPGQPADKVSHEPEGWDEMKSAIMTDAPWRGHVLTQRHPIVNIDYWDAAVYCLWLGRRLPEYNEWFHIVEGGGNLDVDEGFVEVDTYHKDKSKQGIDGLNSGVAEWTNTKAINPEIPMGGRKNIIMGGSYLKVGNAKNEEYVNSDLLRRIDVGFRTVK